MKAILILMDSLNRHFLSAYGNTWVKTPNIDRFAEKCVVFDNHWIGSAPCMPARRDILTGRLNFLEREWGGLEPYDIPFPGLLRDSGIFTHMETDHYHYFHPGGENYHACFNTWNLHRGQEHDFYASRIKALKEPEHLGKWSEQYEKNREAFKTDGDYPSPRTFQGAIKWLQENEGQDNYFLWIEAFDPHEPFDCPQEFLELYEDTWTGPRYNWSAYDRVDRYGPEAVLHLRKCYAATLTMNDKWFGKLMDELERQNAFEDTLIILTTDHGHMLGEHGVDGKNRWHAWNEMSRIPLFVHLPGSRHAGERRAQLTQNIDIMPTLMEYFQVPFDNPIHGRSWMDILEKNAPSKREGALYGWFGMTVNVTDGKYTYMRAPASEENAPLYRYFLTPTTFGRNTLPGKEFFKDAELGHFLSYTDYPVIRAKVSKRRSQEIKDTLLFDIEKDPEQLHNLAGTDKEEEYIRLLKKTMKEMDSPPEQYERLGLK